MLDRFRLDGQLTEFEPDSKLSKVYPIKARFIQNVMGGCDHKGVLVKSHMKPSRGAGHHRFDGETTFREVLAISHYKWIPGAIDRLRASYRLVLDAGMTGVLNISAHWSTTMHMVASLGNVWGVNSRTNDGKLCSLTFSVLKAAHDRRWHAAFGPR